MPQTDSNIQHSVQTPKSFVQRYKVFTIVILIVLVSGAVALFVSTQIFLKRRGFTKTNISEDNKSAAIQEGVVVNTTQVGTRSINPDKPDTSPKGIRFTLKMNSGQENDVFVEFKNKEIKLAILRICKENGECPEFPKIVTEDHGKVGNLQTIQIGDIVIGDHLKLVNKSLADPDYQVFVTRYE